MPCLKCENGLWKFGKTGVCKYGSKSECETANADYYNEEGYQFTFTEEQMNELHKNGEVIIDIEKEGKKMKIHFKYDKKDLVDIVRASAEFTKTYKRKYGNKRA